MNIKKTGFTILVIIPILLLITIAGCKKYADPPPYFEVTGDTTQQAERKVLIIGIDGAIGVEYKSIKPTVLMGLKTHSKYSWEAVSDEATTDAASWKTLMSGVSYFRHQIKDSSFIYTQPPGSNEEHSPIISYPSFFTQLLTTTRADTKTTFITAWPELLTRLLPEVEEKILAANDAAVKDSAVSTLKKVNSDVVIVDFNGVAKAGKAFGFSANSQGYVDAVLKTDGYIGELLAALKSRPEYNKNEEWLIIITGTHGGNGNSYGGPSESETNVPTFYYNENFLEKEFIREGTFAGVEIKGNNANAVKAKLLNDNGLYNPGRGEQTIQIKVKGTSGFYPHFFSKMERWYTTPGWSMFTSGSEWSISIRSTTSGERRLQDNRRSVLDGSWHTITVTIADSASKKWLRKYTDGIRHDQVDITTIYDNNGTVVSPSPITMGFGADPTMGASTYFSADAMIFNTALSDQEIASSICMQDITQHPKYSNLIGYWPGNDGFGGRLKNKAPGQHTDFILEGGYSWAGVPDLPCTTQPNNDPLKESLLVKAVDVAPIFFYWLRLEPKADWGLEGTNWLTKYEMEFVKL